MQAADGAVALLSSDRPLRLAPGARLREAPCLVCRQPLGGAPFIVDVTIELTECDEGDGHLLAAGAARHTACSGPPRRTLCTMISRIANHQPVTA